MTIMALVITKAQEKNNGGGGGGYMDIALQNVVSLFLHVNLIYPSSHIFFHPIPPFLLSLKSCHT